MDFFTERTNLAERNFNNQECISAAKAWHDVSRRFDYQYMFEWMGRPIIQDPQDICTIQEIIWRTQPDLIIETGVARGGSLVLSGSVLASISMGEILRGNPVIKRKVVGVDIDIRAHNRKAIEDHPLASMIELIQGSSIDNDVIDRVATEVDKYNRPMVILDSNHTDEHVYRELIAYAPFVASGSAIFVMDTGIEYAPVDSFNVNRPWGPGNSPLTAVNRFLACPSGQCFKKDRSIEKRMLITCATEGLLVRE